MTGLFGELDGSTEEREKSRLTPNFEVVRSPHGGVPLHIRVDILEKRSGLKFWGLRTTSRHVVESIRKDGISQEEVRIEP